MTETPKRRIGPTHTLARGLGWFSIGLGLAEVIAPRLMARVMGLQTGQALVRGYGVREIAAGIGILAARDPGPWLWARVAGDVLDLATLGLQARRADPRSVHTAVVIAAVAGVAVLDALCANALTREERQARQPRRDYSDRRGLPLPPDEMRGAALENFESPWDLQTPHALRPYVVH